MRISLTIGIFLITCITCFSQGNLIHNASFEDADLDEGSVPCKSGQLPLCSVWESDGFYPGTSTTNIPCKYLSCNKDWCGCICKNKLDGFHTTDWYMNEPGKFLIKETNDRPDPLNINYLLYYNLNGRTGKSYAGMYTHEILEQNFFNSAKMIGGKTYVFTVYVRIPRPIKSYPTATAGCWPSSLTYSKINQNVTNSTNFSLDIMIAASKIKYQDNSFLTCNSTGSSQLKEGLNDIKILNTFNFNISSCPVYQWNRLSFEFTCPTNHTYDWIGLELNDGTTDDGYILIDDVSLVDKCELGCTATSGVPSPLISSRTVNEPNCWGARITNVQNVREITLQTYTISSQLIRTQHFYSTNGFSGGVYWDGNIQSGSSAASDVYLVKATCINDCGTFEFSNKVVYISCSSHYLPNVSDVYTDVAYYDCCELNFYLTSKTFDVRSGPTSYYWYYPKIGIYVDNCTFTQLSNVTLIAGKEIKFSGETNISSGANDFHAFIQDCPDAH